MVTVAAESGYGSIIGFAEIDLAQFWNRGRFVKEEFKVIIFRQNPTSCMEISQNSPKFTAKANISFQQNVIAPELKELQFNIKQKYQKQKREGRSKSRSPTPNKRIVSKSPKDTSSVSPKKKRKMMG